MALNARLASLYAPWWLFQRRDLVIEVGSSFMSVLLKPGTRPESKKTKLVFGDVHEELYHPLNSFSTESRAR